MKFAYFAAALLPLALANTIALDTPNEDGLSALEIREEQDLAFFEERDDDMDMFDMFDERDLEFDEEEEFDEIEARSAGSTLNALHGVVKAINGVDSKLKKIKPHGKPSQKDALAVEKAGEKLAGAVSKAIKAAKSGGKFSKGDSKKIFSYVKGPLKKDTFKSLSAFKARASAFKSGGYTGLVKNRLSALEKQTAQLGHELISKSGVKKYKKSGAKILKSIEKKFKSTIKAF